MAYIYDKSDGLLKAADDATATEAVASGKAFKVDVPALTKAQKASKDAIEDYKRQERKFRTSQDPSMTDEVKQYHINEAMRELEAMQDAIQRTYEEQRAKLIDEAEQMSYRAQTSVKADEREFAEQIGRRFQIDLMSTVNADAKRETLRRLAATIGQMTDGERIAIQGELLRFSVPDELAADFRAVLRAASDLDSFDPLAAKAIGQLPFNASTEYQLFRAARSIRKGSTDVTGGSR